MKIVSVNIGDRKKITYKNKTIETGIFKYPIDKPIFLDKEEVKGDAICNRINHGGINQAVYAYSLKHYEYWKKKYPDLDWQFGIFGENLTIDDIDENNIHVGDTYKVGETIIEATTSRQPCYKLGIRFNDMKIVKQFWNTTKCGVYFKVLQTGNVYVDDKFTLIKKYEENPTIADIFIKRKKEKGIK